MFCPKCRDEFRPGFSQCPDCEVPLVTEPPLRDEPRAQEDEELVTLATYPSIIEASLAKSRLEAEGIAALVPGENIGVFGPGRSYPGGVWPELKVRATDRDRAISALKSRTPSGAADDGTETGDPETVPALTETERPSSTGTAFNGKLRGDVNAVWPESTTVAPGRRWFVPRFVDWLLKPAPSPSLYVLKIWSLWLAGAVIYLPIVRWLETHLGLGHGAHSPYPVGFKNHLSEFFAIVLLGGKGRPRHSKRS